MPDTVGRLSYFLLHPSEYLGLWTRDLTVVGLIHTAATLGIVLRKLRIMNGRTFLMRRQTTIMTAQDKLNRALSTRRLYPDHLSR